jgi:heat shock protein HslJ
MKRKFFVLALFAVWIMNCNSTLKASAIREKETDDRSVSNSSDVTITGKEWKLIEVRINNSDTGFNRKTLNHEGIDRFFTVNFDTGIISGTGAPNRYSAPYTMGDNQSISIMIMRSTLMASFFQPENLTEHDFFTYMQNTYEWKLVNDQLELQSKTAEGSAVNLIFSQ